MRLTFEAVAGLLPKRLITGRLADGKGGHCALGFLLSLGGMTDNEMMMNSPRCRSVLAQYLGVASASSDLYGGPWAPGQQLVTDVALAITGTNDGFPSLRRYDAVRAKLLELSAKYDPKPVIEPLEGLETEDVAQVESSVPLTKELTIA